MASAGHIAKERDLAIRALKETGRTIAALLEIDPPMLEFFYRDRDLQQAEELKAVAAFHQRIISVLEARQTTDEVALEPAPVAARSTRAKSGGRK